MYGLRAFFVLGTSSALIGLSFGCALDPVPGGTGGSATSSTSTGVTSGGGSGGSTSATSTGTGGSGGIGGQGVGGSPPNCDPIKEKLCDHQCVSSSDPEHSCSMVGVCQPCILANVDVRLCDKDEGTCAFGSCSTGFLNCDNEVPNGCEQQVDDEHCGSCVKKCLKVEKCVLDVVEGTAMCLPK